MNILQPTKTLPENYECKGILDLSKDRRALILLNLLAFPLMVIFAGLFIWIADLLRPGFIFLRLPATIRVVGNWGWVLVLVAVNVVMVVVHEGIHGLFFWFFLRERPVFGLRGAYAFAAAPNWFIPRRQYAVIGLSPLVVISLAGLGLTAIVPLSWLTPLLLLLIFNAAGSVGDMMIMVRFFRSPRNYLANDRGDAVALYGPVT